MKHTLTLWLCLLWTLAPAQDPAPDLSAAVIPIPLSELDLEPGAETWLSLEYLAGPRGEVLFREPGEKVWWLQNQAVLLCGASGQELPRQVTGRATAWVRISHLDQILTTLPLFPRRDRILVDGDPGRIRDKLAAKLGPVADAAYLSQIANFLAGNLADLDVTGTSFSIDGFGTVINSAGEWVGEPVAGTSPWTTGSGNIHYTDGNVGIGATDPTAALHVTGAAGALFTGSFGSGDLAATGSGTRFLWYPRKAALRGGQVTGTAWDDDQVGSRSAALGFNTIASGSSAMAFGDAATASGSASAALGFGTLASGTRAVALGSQTTAQAFASLTLGRFNEIAGTSGSWVETDPVLVIGNGASSGDPANAFTILKNGNTGIATADPLAALDVQSNNGVLFGGSFGSGSPAVEGAGTRMLWYPGQAAFRAGQVTGDQWDQAKIGGRSSAFGFNTEASGASAVAFGDSNRASGTSSAAFGFTTSATGARATAFGGNTTAQAFTSFVVGRFNEVAGSTSSWVGTDPLFVVGNGGSAGAPSNAMTVFKNGNLNVTGSASKPGGGTWSDLSDRRLKERIRPLESESALNALCQLQGVRYAWRNPQLHGGERVGVIAQDVAALFPDWVVNITPPGADRDLLPEGEQALAVSFPHDFYGYLIEALKELKQRNEDLQKRLTQLEADRAE